MNTRKFNEVSLAGVRISSKSLLEALLELEDAIENEDQLIQHWFSADAIPKLKRNQKLRSAFNTCDLIHSNCGLLCMLNAWRSGKSLPHVPSHELLSSFIRLAEDTNYRIFFLGNRYELVSNLAEHYAHRLGHRTVAGFYHGHYSPGTESEIAKQIADSGAQIVITDMDVVTQTDFILAFPKLLRRVNVFSGHEGIFDRLAAYDGVYKYRPSSFLMDKLSWFNGALSQQKLMNKVKTVAYLMMGATN